MPVFLKAQKRHENLILRLRYFTLKAATDYKKIVLKIAKNTG